MACARTVGWVSRPLRLELPNGLYHVTARGNARGAIFADDADWVDWNQLLGRVIERFGWLVLASCQMTNHYHLLVETPQANLSRGMRHLNGVYAQRFNRRHGRAGHLFQARFHATLVEREQHLLSVAAYIARNPVRAGLCGDPADWRWSSYRATIGLEPPGPIAIDRLLACFAEKREEGRARYRALVANHQDNRLGDALAASVIYGGETFTRLHTDALTPNPEIPRRQWQPQRPPLDQLLRTGQVADIARAYTHHGYTMREIAAHLGVHYATISRRIHRHEQATA